MHKKKKKKKLVNWKNFVKTKKIKRSRCINQMFSIKCNQLDVHIKLSQKESAPYIWTYIWSIFASSMWGGL